MVTGQRYMSLRENEGGTAYTKDELRVIHAFASNPIWQQAAMPHTELLLRIKRLPDVAGRANLARVAKHRGCERLRHKGLLLYGLGGVTIRPGDLSAQDSNAALRALVATRVRQHRGDLR